MIFRGNYRRPRALFATGQERAERSEIRRSAIMERKLLASRRPENRVRNAETKAAVWSYGEFDFFWGDHLVKRPKSSTVGTERVRAAPLSDISNAVSHF